MPNIILSADISIAILNISYQLERMNDLKEKELKLKYGEDLDV